jgi:hypothetical protein
MVCPVPGVPLRYTPGFYAARLRRLRAHILGRHQNRVTDQGNRPNPRLSRAVPPWFNIITYPWYAIPAPQLIVLEQIGADRFVLRGPKPPKRRRRARMIAWGVAKRNPGKCKIDQALKERQMSRAGFPELTPALLQSLTAWCAQFLGFRFATPQASMRRAFGA